MRLNTDQYEYADSFFYDPHHKHIITRDLRLIQNKLRLLTKGPNYREPQAIKVSESLIEIPIALDTCIEAMKLKTKYTTSNFKSWTEKVLAKVKWITTELKRNRT